MTTKKTTTFELTRLNSLATSSVSYDAEMPSSESTGQRLHITLVGVEHVVAAARLGPVAERTRRRADALWSAVDDGAASAQRTVDARTGT